MGFIFWHLILRVISTDITTSRWFRLFLPCLLASSTFPVDLMSVNAHVILVIHVLVIDNQPHGATLVTLDKPDSVVDYKVFLRDQVRTISIIAGFRSIETLISI